MNDSALFQGGAPALTVPETHCSHQDAGFHLQLLAVIDDFHSCQIEPFRAGMPEGQAKLVGQIHEVFVFDLFSLEFGRQTIVSACQIGSGVVDFVCA